ncbi:hypothetical protein AB0I28_28255 [Phytomonospora sp. NPDC050363]|uniref:hypothetical protein n=1 Tax=Phytomonospora sp. NPDC050363 TaxID=3155642 RepID=UPI0033E8DA89
MAAPQFAVPAKPPRPGVVSIAGYLQFAVFAFALVNAIVSYLVAKSLIPELSEAFLSSGAPSAAEAEEFANLMAITMGVVYFCLLIWPGAFALLGIWTLRGVNGVRITTWILGGIAVLCGLFSVLTSGLQSTLTTSNTTGGGEYAWAQEIDVQSLMPGWFTAYSVIQNIVSTGMYAAVVILLLLPAAHEYFRPARQSVQPQIYLPYEPPGKL